MPHREYIKLCHGSDCAILLIHGILSTPRYFDRFLPAVPEGWSVYNLLLDGHGGSVQDFSHTSMDRWKAQVEGCMAELCARHDRVVVIAHSMGALLTIRSAPNFPQIKGLLLLDAPLKVWVRGRMVVRALNMVFGRVDEDDPWAVAARDSVSVKLTRRLWQYLGWIPRFWELLCLCRQTRSRVADIQVPAWVFHSRQDELVSVKSARYFRDNPHVRHEILEASGHFYFPAEDFACILRAMDQLLNDKNL